MTIYFVKSLFYNINIHLKVATENMKSKVQYRIKILIVIFRSNIIYIIFVFYSSNLTWCKYSSIFVWQMWLLWALTKIIPKIILKNKNIVFEYPMVMFESIEISQHLKFDIIFYKMLSIWGQILLVEEKMRQPHYFAY